MLSPLKLRRAAFAALLQAVLVLPAVAGPQAVVELFTSQGCSSCPPADALLAELAKRPNVVALSFPVDYWDYLGWKDTLAHPSFSMRQRAYAHGRSDRQIYTPQVVVNGVKPIVGSDRDKIESVVAKLVNNGALPVTVAVNETGSTITVEVGAVPGAASSAEVWLLPVAKTREVTIGRGENKGRTIIYANVVRGMTKLGDWSGPPARFEVPASSARPGDADAYVVLVQTADEAKPRAILGAAKGPGF